MAATNTANSKNIVAPKAVQYCRVHGAKHVGVAEVGYPHAKYPYIGHYFFSYTQGNTYGDYRTVYTNTMYYTDAAETYNWRFARVY